LYNKQEKKTEENRMLTTLTKEELEEYQHLVSQGKNPFEALTSVTGREEAFRELAQIFGYPFSSEPPETAKEVREGVYFDGERYYTHDPSLAPSEPVVIIPPLKREERQEEKSEDFWVEIINRCVKEGWGDIHFEPTLRYYRVRVRNEIGKLEEIKVFNKETGEKLLRQLLVRANVDTTNPRIAKDGSISFADLDNRSALKKETVEFLEELKKRGALADLRISVIPTVKGESAVIRVLPKKKTAIDNLALLGYEEEHVRKLSGYPKLNQGLIVVSGPTGSGKSTLSWWMLKEANPEKRKIVSVEDPVEAEIMGVQQVEVRRPVRNKDGKVVGIDFALAMRAFMRQNPDVIFVGEVRDPETAEAVVEASNTGHLVITTVHANDEVETLKRILFLLKGRVDLPSVVNALRLIVAQRLLPRLCPVCKEKGYLEKIEIDDSLLSSLPAEGRELLESRKGEVVYSLSNVKETCGKCKGGYSGRLPVVGILEFNRELRDFIVDSGGNFTHYEFLKRAKTTGFKSFRDDALEKLSKGLVALEDVINLL